MIEEVSNYVLEDSKTFLEGMKKHQKSGQQIVLEKIFTLLEEIENHPEKGSGKPEPLKGYKDRSVWSRRIDKKHRLTYEIFEDLKKVKLLSSYGHYTDK